LLVHSHSADYAPSSSFPLKNESLSRLDVIEEIIHLMMNKKINLDGILLCLLVLLSLCVEFLLRLGLRFSLEVAPGPQADVKNSSKNSSIFVPVRHPVE
jgi:hypothetical protein